jgi:NitT/TauT family transport system permease protein
MVREGSFWEAPYVWKTGIVLAFLVVWEGAVRIMQVERFLLPPPSEVLRALWETSMSGELPARVLQSLKVLLISSAIGIGLALTFTPFAILTRLGREMLETVTSMFNPLPAVALLPISLLWFGLGVKSLIFVVVHSVVWPMMLSTYAGFSTVPRILVRVGRSFGLRGSRLTLGILLPAALPHLISGVKIGWAFAWRTMIAAELVFGVSGSQGGVGWYIYEKRYAMETAAMFAGLITVILIGLLVENVLFGWVEKRTIRRWGMSVHHA